MRTVILVILLLFIFWKVSAPEVKAFYIEKIKKINPYEKLIYAIGKIECDHDTLAINWNELAYGYFQIRPVRIKDYNRRTSENYSVVDMLDYRKAERVFMYYADKIGYRNPEKIARSWNGSGKKTLEYWSKVKKYL